MSAAFVTATSVLPRNRSLGSSNVCHQAAASSFTGLQARQQFPALRVPSRRVAIWLMKVGIYFSTTTGNTEDVATAIKTALGDEADEPQEIAEADASKMAAYDMLIVGSPTWNTGADTERSGTSWDDFLYEDLPNMDLSGKPVAVFGLGDVNGYSDYFCDAMEEVHDCFAKQGAKMIGYTDTDAYDFEESKSVRDGKFLGLAFDNVNGQYEIEECIEPWCKAVMSEAGLPIAA